MCVPREKQQVVSEPTVNQAPGGHTALPYRVTPLWECLHLDPDYGIIGSHKLKNKLITHWLDFISGACAWLYLVDLVIMLEKNRGYRNDKSNGLQARQDCFLSDLPYEPCWSRYPTATTNLLLQSYTIHITQQSTPLHFLKYRVENLRCRHLNDPMFWCNKRKGSSSDKLFMRIPIFRYLLHVTWASHLYRYEQNLNF